MQIHDLWRSETNLAITATQNGSSALLGRVEDWGAKRTAFEAGKVAKYRVLQYEIL
jgi:hypothetical protein